MSGPRGTWHCPRQQLLAWSCAANSASFREPSAGNTWSGPGAPLHAKGPLFSELAFFQQLAGSEALISAVIHSVFERACWVLWAGLWQQWLRASVCMSSVPAWIMGCQCHGTRVCPFNRGQDHSVHVFTCLCLILVILTASLWCVRVFVCCWFVLVFSCCFLTCHRIRYTVKKHVIPFFPLFYRSVQDK